MTFEHAQRTTRLLGRTAAVVVAALFTLTLLAGFLGGMWRFVLAGVTGHAGPMMHGGPAAPMTGAGFQMGFGLPLGTVVALALPVAVLLGVAYLGYRTVVGTTGEAATDPALTELRTAYARGDVTDEEFETRRERLEHPE